MMSQSHLLARLPLGLSTGKPRPDMSLHIYYPLPHGFHICLCTFDVMYRRVSTSTLCYVLFIHMYSLARIITQNILNAV